MIGGSLLLKLKSLFLHKKEPFAVLPDELYIEIFLRLPVRSTFTCKCVSKKWLSIISDPDSDFVNLHLKYTLEFNNNSRFILSGCDRRTIIRASQIYTITKHSLFSTDEFYDKAVVMKNHPFKSAKLVGIWGSCNGLVCLLHDNNVRGFVSLWNPATKEYKRIPDSPNISVRWQTTFCYDYKNDDYKLVSARMRTPCSLLVYVYTLRSNSWKTLQTKPYSVQDFNAVLVNGALHWISETPKVIVSFNISDERFKEIQLPGEIMEKMVHLRTTLKVLEGCLCVIFLELNEAWVMREYGVLETWTEIEDMIADKYNNLKWSSEDGECLIYSQGTDLVAYEHKHSGGARRLKLRFLKIGVVDNYVESLVSLNTGTYMGRKEITGYEVSSINKVKYLIGLLIILSIHVVVLVPCGISPTNGLHT